MAHEKFNITMLSRLKTCFLVILALKFGAGPEKILFNDMSAL